MGRLNPESALTMTVDFAQYQMLRSSDAAKILAITVTQLHSLAAHGEIRYVNVGTSVKRETRRYRVQDIQAFVEERTRTGTVKWSTTPPVEITDGDLIAAAKEIARNRKRREREKERSALQAKRQKQRQERERWLKRCEEEANAIRERLALESIFGKGKVPLSFDEEPTRDVKSYYQAS